MRPSNNVIVSLFCICFSEPFEFNDISMSCVEIGTVGFSVTKRSVRKKLAALLTYVVHALEAACIIQLPVEGGGCIVPILACVNERSF